MDEEIIKAIVPHIPTIVGCVVSLVVSTLALCYVMLANRRERIKKDFEREYGEPLKFTNDDLVKCGLDGFKVIAPKGKKIVELTDCEFVKRKENSQDEKTRS